MVRGFGKDSVKSMHDTLQSMRSSLLISEVIFSLPKASRKKTVRSTELVTSKAQPMPIENTLGTNVSLSRNVLWPTLFLVSSYLLGADSRVSESIFVEENGNKITCSGMELFSVTYRSSIFSWPSFHSLPSLRLYHVAAWLKYFYRVRRERESSSKSLEKMSP